MRGVRTTLQELLTYYHVNRGAGHTAAVVAGAENLEDCIVVAANQSSAALLSKGNMFTVVTLAGLENGDTRGRRCPMVLDNHAVIELARQSLAEIARLEAKIAKMRNAAQAIADTSFYD